MASANSSFPTEVAAAAWEKYRPTFIAQFVRKNLFLWLAKRFGMYLKQKGNPSIVQPIILDVNSTFSSYSRYDYLNDAPSQTLDAVSFAWKYFSIAVLIDGQSLFESGGDTQAVSLWSAKVKQAELSTDIQMGVQAFGDGTGNDGKDLVGWRSMIDSDGTFGTYGGINSLTYTNWRNQYSGSVGPFATNGEAAMRTMYNDCLQGMNDKPTAIITTQSIHEAYEKTLTNNLFVTLKDLNGGDSGFTALLWKGLPVLWHDSCQSGLMYFPNFNYQGFVVGAGKEFVMVEKQVDKQDARKSYIMAAINMICTNRSAQGVLAGIT